MEAQFGRAPLASLPAPDFVTSAALARPLLQALCNVRLEGTMIRSSAGARVPSLSYGGCRAPFAMSEDVAAAALLFVAAWVHLPDILVLENGGPQPAEPGEAPPTKVSLETFGVTV